MTEPVPPLGREVQRQIIRDAFMRRACEMLESRHLANDAFSTNRIFMEVVAESMIDALLKYDELAQHGENRACRESTEARMMKRLRTWWRKGKPVPSRYLPSTDWWHTRSMSDVSFSQAFGEEQSWIADANRRWRDGEKMNVEKRG
jgi:hypothetical protein